MSEGSAAGTSDARGNTKMSRYLSVWILVLAMMCGGLAAQDWQAQASGTTELLLGVWFTTQARGFVVGQTGTVLETELR